MSEFIRRIAGKIGNDTMRVFKTEHLEDWVCRLAGEHEGAALMQKSRPRQPSSMMPFPF